MLPKIRSATKQEDWVHLRFHTQSRASHCQNWKSYTRRVSTPRFVFQQDSNSTGPLSFNHSIKTVLAFPAKVT